VKRNGKRSAQMRRIDLILGLSAELRKQVRARRGNKLSPLVLTVQRPQHSLPDGPLLNNPTTPL
jgi:hypothetical protein